jgi:hypothetical protein
MFCKLLAVPILLHRSKTLILTKRDERGCSTLKGNSKEALKDVWGSIGWGIILEKT